MMNRRMLFTANLRILAVIVLVTVAAPGCVTTGSGDQVTNTVYQTHKIVSKLDQDLTASVNNLNTTAADLNAKVTANEQQMREIQGTVGENQTRLQQMQTQLTNLTATLYKQFNMSYAPATANTPPPGVIAGPPRIGEPTTAPAMTPTVESPADMPPTTAPADIASPPEPASDEPATDKATYSLALQRFEEKDYADSLKYFDQYLQKYPTGERVSGAQFWKAESVYRVGQQAKDVKKYEEAIGEYKKYRTQYPNDANIPYAMYNQAAAHLKLQQKAQAVALLQELVSKYPATERPVIAAQKELKNLSE